MPPSQHDLDEHRRNEQRLLAVLITKELARCEDPHNPAVGLCVLCYEAQHAADCPWQMAQEWAKNSHRVDQ